MTRLFVRAISAALGAGALLLSARARAHLMAADRGTINVVGDGVFVVLSVPTSALSGVDDDGDGVVDQGELSRHEAAIREQVERRLSIFDGDRRATTVRIDLVLSPAHEGAPDRADQLVVLEHARFDAPPAALRVTLDLFPAQATDARVELTATRHPASGTEAHSVTFTPRAPTHVFFAPAESASPPDSGDRSGGAPVGLVPLGALFGVALVLSWSSRTRRTSTAGAS